jgi:DNA-binding transcriptional MerR regulator
VEDIKAQLDALVKETQHNRTATAAAKRRRANAAKRKQELDAKVAQLEDELHIITQVRQGRGGGCARVCSSCRQP